MTNDERNPKTEYRNPKHLPSGQSKLAPAWGRHFEFCHWDFFRASSFVISSFIWFLPSLVSTVPDLTLSAVHRFCHPARREQTACPARWSRRGPGFRSGAVGRTSSDFLYIGGAASGTDRRGWKYPKPAESGPTRPG